MSKNAVCKKLVGSGFLATFKQDVEKTKFDIGQLQDAHAILSGATMLSQQDDSDFDLALPNAVTKSADLGLSQLQEVAKHLD